MENEQVNTIIPENKIGKAVDIEHLITKSNREEAIDTFKRATKRLLNVPVWHKLCGIASAEFKLIGSDGEEKHRLAEVNDYFQIDVPGPGSVAGGGYDWVKVESITDKTNPDAEEESFAMTVRACKHPKHEDGVTAHFFTSDATSSFVITRMGNTIKASYYGRNEVANTDTTDLVDKIRNKSMATIAIAGLSELQWSELTKEFLQEEIGG